MERADSSFRGAVYLSRHKRRYDASAVHREACRTAARYGRPAIAQCRLQIIDSASRPAPAIEQWDSFPIARFLAGWLDRPHLRRAPLDGILHGCLGSVFTSHTQILIDKRIYEHVGLYRSDWGSSGDFEWGCRASLLYDTLFVPQTLATWRRHEDQQSQTMPVDQFHEQLIEMFSQAYEASRHRPI